MRIAAINMLSNGSPANIMRGILKKAENNDIAECRSYYGNWTGTSQTCKGSVRFGFYFENIASAIMSKYLGFQNTGSIIGTKSLIKQLDAFNPDVIHLHNLHLWCINIPMLFKYIKKNNKKVIWTFHDCWPITGRCPYFLYSKCEKWKTGCNSCVYPKKNYPASYVDCSSRMWKSKKKWFTGIERLIIVTPSQWLAGIICESFLADYPVYVINNGIDLETFTPRDSDRRALINIPKDKCLLLGIAYSWSFYKGLDVFIELSKKLDDSYQILMVGVDDSVKKILPENIMTIEKTHNIDELAELYSSADIMINPTREENYPTACMECIACGTPVITFDTGGCKEIVNSECGYVTDENTTEAIIRILNENKKTDFPSVERCVNRAKSFDMENKYESYMELYRHLSTC